MPAPRRPAWSPRRPSCAAACTRTASEPLEPRRLFAVELVTAAAGTPLTTGDGAARLSDVYGGAPTASVVSDDGRFVAFSSGARNLVAGVTPDGTGDVFVRDRAAATTVLASARADGQPAGNSFHPSISGDGRLVAFVSDRRLVAGDTNLYWDVYVRDLRAGTTALVSHTPAGGAGNAASDLAVMSRNGRYVVFSSGATNIVPGAGDLEGGIYRHDVQTGAIELVAYSTPSGGVVDLPQVSDDGNVVGYTVHSIDAGDSPVSNGYVKDMRGGAVTPASVASSGAPAGGGPEFTMELSGDGRKVAFVTRARAAANDANDAPDVFLRDLAAGTTTLVSVGPGGTSIPDAGATEGHGSGLSLNGGRSLSADGRFVVVESTDLLTDDPDRGTDPQFDVYVRDTVAGTTRLLSTDPPGDASEEGYIATVSSDGRYAAFLSDSPAFSGLTDLKVVEVATGAQLAVPTRRPDGTRFDPGDDVSAGAVFSRSGNLLAFAGDGDADGLAPGLDDANGGSDVFAVALAGVPADAQPPAALAPALPPMTAPAAFYEFDMTWSDDVWIDGASITDGDLVVVLPDGRRRPVEVVTATTSADGKDAIARYRVTSPAGSFDAAANGTYALEVAPGQVSDAAGNAAAAGPLGTFTVNIPMPDGPDLHAVSLQGAVPASAVAGAKVRARPLALTVRNAGTAPSSGRVALRLVASADDVADALDSVVAELPARNLVLAPGRERVFRLKPAAYPAVPEGDYRLLGVVDATGVLAERLESNNAAAHPTPVRIAAPFVDLGLSAPALAGRARPGRGATVMLTVRNDGNIDAKGSTPLRVRLTPDPADPAAASHAFDVSLKLNLKAGVTRPARVRVSLPADLPPGSYFLVAELLSGGPWPDPDASDDAATSTAAFVV